MFILKRRILKRKSKPYLRYRADGGKRFRFTSSIQVAGHFRDIEDSAVLEVGMQKKGIQFIRVPVKRENSGRYIDRNGKF
jgi:hypothetical protein